MKNPIARLNSQRRSHPLFQDLENVFDAVGNNFTELGNQRILITGGTGFFGCWLLESFAWVNEKLNLNSSAMVLTRNPEGFRKKFPHLAGNPAIQFHNGDVRDFDFPPGDFSHIIHAATDASSDPKTSNPIEIMDTIIQGTRRVLDFAVQCGARKILLCSSGAVYGPQPPEMIHIPEEYQGGPDCLDSSSAYAEGKRIAELLWAIYGRKDTLECKIARCFAFVGPYFPLSSHFAIGNFIHNGLHKQPIIIKGDGTPIRSYLYAADLAVWLWTILFKGKSCYPYNVGSEQEISIGDLARMISRSFSPEIPVQIMKTPVPGKVPECYTPSTMRAKKDLHLKPLTSLEKAIEKTISWYRHQ